MINTILHFFYMGGYAWYVWSAYACVFIYLFIQWFLPWKRWQKYVREQDNLK